jgi:hypothetical protein
MSLTKNLKKRGLKLLFCGAIVLTLLGGARLGSEMSSAHAAPAQPHLLVCGNGGVGFPPCE